MESTTMVTTGTKGEIAADEGVFARAARLASGEGVFARAARLASGEGVFARAARLASGEGVFAGAARLASGEGVFARAVTTMNAPRSSTRPASLERNISPDMPPPGCGFDPASWAVACKVAAAVKKAHGVS